MKETLSYEKLLAQFTGRKAVLEKQNEELREAYDRYVENEALIAKLVGAIETAQYLATGELPKDGFHDNMGRHQPKGSLDSSEL